MSTSWRRSIVVLLLVFGLMALSWLLWQSRAVPGASSSLQEPTKMVPASLVASQTSKSEALPARDADFLRQDAAAWRDFRVVDDAGRAVEGASVHVWPSRGARVARASARVATGLTDVAGGCRISEQLLSSGEWQQACVTATMPGFGHAWLPEISAGVNLLVLREGEGLGIRCVLADGGPLANVRVGLSLTQPYREHELSDGLPVGPPTDSVHSSVSGVDGRCTVSGLQRASYILAVEHPWAMLRTRLKDGYYVDVGGEQELEIVFEEPLVVAFAISSRPTIKWFVTPQPRMRAPHPGAAQYGGLVMRLRHQAEQLGLADSFYSYVVTKGELAIGQSVQVVYHVPGLGWNVAAVPFVNASLSSLVVIDPAEPHPCSERGLVVRYLTPDGQLSSLSSCRLELLDLADSSSCPVELSPRLLVWDVKCGERIVVPCGNYRIRPPRVAHGFETEHPSILRVVPGVGDQSVEIREVHPMVRVRIDAMTQDGTVLGFYHLRIHRLDQPASYQHTYSTTYPEVFVPLGVYQFEVHLPGFEVGVLEHTFLDASPEACHETLVLSRVE